MQVARSSEYVSSIYYGIVVNEDIELDPENLGRVQIYIPSVHYNYSEHYEGYMGDKNKESNPYFKSFPWAITLDNTYKNGDEVYGSYVDGQNNNYIILGKATSNYIYTTGDKANKTTSNINLTDITNLAIPIILHNEVGIKTTDWKDNISNSAYTTITLHDGGRYNKTTKIWEDQGSWSVGLLQWNSVRAFDCLCYIASKNSNWISAFSGSESKDLVQDIKKSLDINSSGTLRQKYGNGYNLTEGTALYNGVKTMLGTTLGKQAQCDLVYNDVSNIANYIKGQGVTNPAIIIYLTDLMNQYGTGLPETIRVAVNASNRTDLDLMKQLDVVVKKVKDFATYETYKVRRETTYSYINTLYSKGKFNNVPLTDISGTNSSVVPVGNGQYCIPFVGKLRISAVWGKYGYSSQHSGSRYHTGVDFAGNTGTPLIACTDGMAYIHTNNSGSGVSAGFGKSVRIEANDDNWIYYGHMSSFNTKIFSKIEVGQKVLVEKGDVIGYLGSTGNSTGPHLHFEIRKPPHVSHITYQGDDMNPLPFIGITGKARPEGVEEGREYIDYYVNGSDIAKTKPIAYI